MSEIKLRPCPICGCSARFEYAAPMDSGKRPAKVRCSVGCIEQIIFLCEEEDAAKAWNFRANEHDMLTALETVLARAVRGEKLTTGDQAIVASAIEKATGRDVADVVKGARDEQS